MKKILTLLALTLIGLHSWADDIEIYTGNNTGNSINPNVVFVFDTSGSMDYCSSSTELESTSSTSSNCVSKTSRLTLAKAAANNTIDSLNNINIALMRYNTQTGSGQNDSNYRGGYLLTKMLNMSDEANKTTIKDQINKLTADGGTPLTEAVHEAYNFLRGGEVIYGKNKDKDKYYGVTKEVSANNKYISPVIDSCQKNHIILFTDGDSSVDGESNSTIQNWMKSISSRPTDLTTNCTSNGGGNTEITDSCLEELAYYMYNSPDLTNSNNPQVYFHAIGGFLEGQNSQTFLDNAARHGKGISASANNAEELNEALTKIVNNIIKTAGTFTTPAVAVNAFNSLEQLDQIYYSVFKPNDSAGWSGNLKRYRFYTGKIVDAKGQDAIDSSSGFFANNATSFWTKTADAPDGDDITIGGMASRLADSSRKIYSNLKSNKLTEADNRVSRNNTLLSAELLATHLSGNELKKMRAWIGGEEPNNAGQARGDMADPLHSNPVLINYGRTTEGSNEVPDSTIFIGTNSGYLHAFDTNANSPKERYAFIPKELLKVAGQYYENSGVKHYGLDGQISLWHDDQNNNRIVDNNEQAMLYVGMRRGGYSYYALDISNRNAPQLAWQINGAQHPDGPTPGFEELGQTWSKMLPINISWNGQVINALVFSGGYDPAEDSNLSRQEHSMGNAVYLVNAKTGALLWKASNNNSANLKLAQMSSAIPANVTAVDDNSDGLVDLLYLADLGGRIWRIDFDQTATNANQYATGGVIFDLGKDKDQTNNVRFFDSIDVVYTRAFDFIKQAGSEKTIINNIPRYMLNIGSGYRAHPLDEHAQDNFYVLFDYNVSGPAKNNANQPKYDSLSRTDLQEYRFNANHQVDIKPSVKSNNGFYLRLIDYDQGEKVLSKAMTLNNVIYFSTYRPSHEVQTSCHGDIGLSRMYSINLSPATYTDNKVQVKVRDSNSSGIPSSPTVLIDQSGLDNSQDSKPIIVDGLDLYEAENPQPIFKKTYWREIE